MSRTIRLFPVAFCVVLCLLFSSVAFRRAQVDKSNTKSANTKSSVQSKASRVQRQNLLRAAMPLDKILSPESANPFLMGTNSIMSSCGSGTWSEQAHNTASDSANGDHFGSSVAINGDTVVVGAKFDSTTASDFSGSAYVFTRSGSVWTEQQKLTASDGADDDEFGTSVAISGDTVVVGTPPDDTMVGSQAGSAYVFTRSGSIWTQQQQLTASDTTANDFFGQSVAINGDTIVVGSYLDDTTGGSDVGSAYVFIRSGSVWSEQQQLTASDGAVDDHFGSSVGISGDTVVVSAREDDTTGGTDAGSAYIFTRSGSVWTQQQNLIASDGDGDDDFGVSVGISGDTVIAGAPLASGNVGSSYIFVTCNNAPTISAQTNMSRQQGSGGHNQHIATISDAEDLEENLVVTVNGISASGANSVTSGGVTISNLTIDSMGIVKADAEASCTATMPGVDFTLRVTDSGSLFAETTLTVNVSENDPPALAYPSSVSAVFGESPEIDANTASDNGTIISYEVLPGHGLTTPPTVGSSPTVIITNAGPAGAHTITVRATDNCGTTTDASFILNVSKADTTTTIINEASLNSTSTDVGQAYAVQWSVTANSPLTGTVTVTDGTDSCMASVSAGECNLTSTTTGLKTITATYSGDDNFNTSTSAGVSHQVVTCTNNMVVTNTDDSGAGSLRDAVANTCYGSTITFDTSGVFATPQTITLTSGEIIIGKNLTITGTGASMLTVSGNNLSRIFSISSGSTVNINGFTLTGGNGVGASGNNTGGAIYNNGTLNLTSSVVSGNTTTSNGGGIRSNVGTMTITDCTISGNNAGTYGGGLRINGGTVNIIRSTISGNIANDDTGSVGGGIDNDGSLNITNSTISGNTVPGGPNNGGGIWSGSSSTANITNSTITNNSVVSGMDNAGGFLNDEGTVTVHNSIIAANVGNTTIPDVANSVSVPDAAKAASGKAAKGRSGSIVVEGGSGFISSGYNLIGNVGDVTNFNQTGDQTGTGASPLDPRLAPLMNNGGVTQTHRLLPHSPALDKGSAFGSTTDQRGLTRLADLNDSLYPDASSGDGSDIGAFEAQTIPIDVPLDFDGDGKSDYAVIQGTFSRTNNKRDGKIKEVVLSGDLLADERQRIWNRGYNKLLHLRAGRGFIGLPADVQEAQARWKEQGLDDPMHPSTEGTPVALNWLIRRSSDGSTLNYSLGTNTDEFVPADYDGDGMCDAAVWNPSTGFTVILSSTSTTVNYPLGAGNMNVDPTVVGDYDGDGLDDPAVYDSTTGMWSWLGGSSHATPDSATWFTGGIPAPGDYNGDGKMDFAVQLPPVAAPDVAKFRIAFNDGNIGPASDIALTYGLAVYAIVPGDYDGDGITDIAQVNLIGSSMVWRVLQSSTNYTAQVKRTFGVVSTDRSVQGDYDGDGKIDLAIYRRGSSPEDGVFIVFQSSTLTQSSPFDWGDVNDYSIGFFNTH